MKALLPRGLFGRAFLIVALPTVLVQLVTAYIFLERHWDNVSRRMANALAGEMSFTSYLYSGEESSRRDRIIYLFVQNTGMEVQWQKGEQIPATEAPKDRTVAEFAEQLRERMDFPFTVIRQGDDRIAVFVQLREGVLVMSTSSKRLESPTIDILLLWMACSSLLFLVIALLFMRNQIRPIQQLAEIAERFGRGEDAGHFKPSGATEVRRAGRAFMVMRERISRQIRTRTEMLAGISHDLRTPLTRMKLQLALEPNKNTQTLNDDIRQMESMISEYLDFARGAHGESSEPTALEALVTDVVEDYLLQGKPVTYHSETPITLALRPMAFRRLLNNLTDNALRYGTRCVIVTRIHSGKAELAISDDGPGIPAGQREEVFRPFTRLDASRNADTGGVGLGLTIVRDIVLAHGGTIALTDSDIGGLSVIIRLPYGGDAS